MCVIVEQIDLIFFFNKIVHTLYTILVKLDQGCLCVFHNNIQKLNIFLRIGFNF